MVFGFFVLLLPFNIKKFLAILLPYSDVVFNTWTAAFLYLSDLLLGLILILWLIRIIKKKFVVSRPLLIIPMNLLAFVIFVSISTLLWTNQAVSWLGVIRWAEILIIMVYATSVITTWRRRITLVAIWFFTMTFQAVIGLLQFVQQRSVGLKWLGESVLSTSITNVAEIVVGEHAWLRSYGTQVHPNVLGFLLVISLLFGFYLYVRVKSGSWRVVISALAGLQSIALITTFSRTAWISLVLGFGVLGVLCILWRRFSPLRMIGNVKSYYPLIITASVLVAGIISFWPMISARLVTGDSHGDMAVSIRQELSQKGWDRFAEHPWFGIGLNQFVASLSKDSEITSQPWKFQPIHNVCQLALVETGIIGVALLGYIVLRRLSQIFLKLKNVPRGTFFNRQNEVLYVFVISSGIFASLFLMTFDHYIFDVYVSMLVMGLLLSL